MEEFKILLRKKRIHLGFTQNQMAQLIGVPESTYKSWEYGTALPSYENRKVLSETMPEFDEAWEREKNQKSVNKIQNSIANIGLI